MLRARPDRFLFSARTEDNPYLRMFPGSLMKLPALGLWTETDPFSSAPTSGCIQRTTNIRFPTSLWPSGEYRVAFTTRGSRRPFELEGGTRSKPSRVLRGSHWDGGIIFRGSRSHIGRYGLRGRASPPQRASGASIWPVFCTDSKSE